MPRKSARKKAIQKKIKRVLYAFSAFVISSLFLGGFFIYKNLTRGYSAAFSSSSITPLNESLYSVAFVTVDDFENETQLIKRINFVLVDVENSKIVNYEISPFYELDMPGVYGVEPLSNMLALCGLSAKNTPEDCFDLANSSISKFFGFPVDRYVFVQANKRYIFEDLLDGELDFLGKDINFTALNSTLKTNFKLVEIFELYKFSQSLPDDRTLRVELGETYYQRPNLLDEELQDLTFSLEISNENKSIAVLNATDTSGVANVGARLLRNMGGRVVAVDNSASRLDKSILITNNPESHTAQFMQEFFNISQVLSIEEATSFTDSEIVRSDITVLIGLDFANSI
ncbi:LytR C-terminal domain-containing protein [Patescibacteria group bacterium]